MKKARLIFGCGPDSFYATKMEVPDPFIYFEDPAGQRHMVLSALEIDRGRRVAQVEHIHNTADIADQLRAAGQKVSYAGMMLFLLSQHEAAEVEVPAEFPAKELVELQKAGIHVHVSGHQFFTSRVKKTSEEIEKLRESQHINQQGFLRAFDVLRESEIGRDDVLMWRGEVLTAEMLRGQMNARLAELGAVPMAGGPIVGGGAQGADPHERGTGPLKAHEFIIIDSFPRGANFYYGDLTRTVMKGTPTQWHLDVYDAVKNAQQLALDMIQEGVNGKDVHAAVDAYFVEHGFETGVDENGANYGFFHGTGHSVGLDVHDEHVSTLSRVDWPLEAGHITSVEPGLYYPGKGGVRIEDVVAVTKDGCDNLTTLPKQLVVE